MVFLEIFWLNSTLYQLLFRTKSSYGVVEQQRCLEGIKNNRKIYIFSFPLLKIGKGAKMGEEKSLTTENENG